MGEIVVNVPADAGTSEKWGDWIILREPPEQTVVLDLGDLGFVDPLFLLRLRGFIDWHCANGHAVRIVPPSTLGVRNYLSRMHVAEDLPPNCECDLGTVYQHDRRDVLIPVRRLTTTRDGDLLDDELAELYTAHFQGPLGQVAEAFARTVSEMCDNATTHGASAHGAYVAAQRYKNKRAVLAIGDLGIGIPEHIRKAYPHLTADEHAIREATKEGITATGNPHRGIGYQYVIDGLKETRVPAGELRIWSGLGRFRVETRDGIQVARRAWAVERPTAGTWVRLEVSTEALS